MFFSFFEINHTSLLLFILLGRSLQNMLLYLEVTQNYKRSTAGNLLVASAPNLEGKEACKLPSKKGAIQQCRLLQLPSLRNMVY